MSLQKFYFSTGVKQTSSPKVPLMEHQEWSSNGVKLIAFYCEDVPENATFLMACDNNKIPEYQSDKIIIKEIVKGGLVSKFAYFLIP